MSSSSSLLLGSSNMNQTKGTLTTLQSTTYKVEVLYSITIVDWSPFVCKRTGCWGHRQIRFEELHQTPASALIDFRWYSHLYECVLHTNDDEANDTITWLTICTTNDFSVWWHPPLRCGLQCQNNHLTIANICSGLGGFGCQHASGPPLLSSGQYRKRNFLYRISLVKRDDVHSCGGLAGLV